MLEESVNILEKERDNALLLMRSMEAENDSLRCQNRDTVPKLERDLEEARTQIALLRRETEHPTREGTKKPSDTARTAARIAERYKAVEMTRIEVQLDDVMLSRENDICPSHSLMDDDDDESGNASHSMGVATQPAEGDSLQTMAAPKE